MNTVKLAVINTHESGVITQDRIETVTTTSYITTDANEFDDFDTAIIHQNELNTGIALDKIAPPVYSVIRFKSDIEANDVVYIYLVDHRGNRRDAKLNEYRMDSSGKAIERTGVHSASFIIGKEFIVLGDVLSDNNIGQYLGMDCTEKKEKEWEFGW
jgi:hypothetical protein